MRIFNGREIELLAPAGTFKDFLTIIQSKADAVYFGGKNFNMRMHRKDHNLTNEEIEEAIALAHSLNKKVYITFNNMMNEKEIKACEEFLIFLDKVQPDALIIQDFGVIKKIKDLNLNLNMHLSVMANVHNKPMIERVIELGVTRVVTSREISLDTIKSLSKDLNVEFEYFIHGDMCSVHGAQCLYSGMLFGKSSNRGLCMKPCRWCYKQDNSEEYLYPLAVKDMSLFRQLPELLNSGVCSFKIEGRMRDSEHLLHIINSYGETIDKYIEEPTAYSIDEIISNYLYDHRVRNISTAYAFKKPGSINIDMDGKREPRIFSRAVEEFDCNEQRVAQLEEKFKNVTNTKSEIILSVKVNNLEALKAAYDNGAREIYISSEVFKPLKPFSKSMIGEGVKYASKANIYYALPRMADERQILELHHLIPELKSMGVKGLVISNLGQVKEFSIYGLELIGDFGLNILNSASSEFYHNEGVKRITLSLESTADNIIDLMKNSKVSMEIVVQGAPTVMYLEHCLAAAKHNTSSQDWCLDYCLKENMDLIDEKGNIHPVFADQYCKNHILPSKDISLLPIISSLKSLGISSFRIEGCHYDSATLGKIVNVYINSLYDENPESLYAINDLKEITRRGQSLQALNYD